jgi:tellurite resistance protein TerC
MHTVGTPIFWIGFTVFVLTMLAIDLGVFHRKTHAVSFREAISWTAVWVTLIFAALVHYWFGPTKALEFLTGYVIEEALSVDNLFVFLILFGAFRVPKELQHTVLFWGVLGALVMRAIFIVAGAALIANFHWVIYVFGAVLLYTGFKLLKQSEPDVDPRKNPLYRIVAKIFPSTHEYEGNKFFTMRNGKRYATPLFLVLVAVEGTDLVFAVDSVPAIFAVTTDPFIVYTSNVFAILGLRSLYFALAGAMDKFRHLHYGLAFVLIFVGVKMLISGYYKIPIVASLVVIAGTLAAAMIASLLDKRPLEEKPEKPDESLL